MEKQLGAPVPKKIKDLLTEFGYESLVSMSQITDTDIEEIKEHGLTCTPKIMVASGHKYFIKSLAEASKKCLAVPDALKVKEGRKYPVCRGLTSTQRLNFSDSNTSKCHPMLGLP